MLLKTTKMCTCNPALNTLDLQPKWNVLRVVDDKYNVNIWKFYHGDQKNSKFDVVDRIGPLRFFRSRGQILKI